MAGVWTRDLGRAHRVARELRCGQVYVNTYGAGTGIELPFGGYKKSGIGREKGIAGYLEYTQTKERLHKGGCDMSTDVTVQVSSVGPRLTGKTSIITGAGSGMGYAAVERFLAEGGDVVAIDLRDEGLEKLRDGPRRRAPDDRPPVT